MTTSAVPVSGNSPAEQARPPGLSRRRKAAVVLQMLLADGKKLSLTSLPEDVQLNLTRELASLRLVDRDTLYAVATEFADDLERVGLTTPGGVDSTLKALADQISPETASRFKSEAGSRRGAVDPWAQIVSMECKDLVPIMTQESTEVAAVVLSKLPVAKAAELLGLLPGETARRITYAVSQTGAVKPEAVKRIGVALAAAHCSKPVPAFAHPPVQRVGAILNSSLAATRDAVLEGLGSDDPAFAEEVRKAIFTFPDIPERLEKVDVPKVIRAVDNDVLVTGLTFALAAGGGDAEAGEFILSNMSQRMADSLREEIGERGRVRKADGEGALGQVVTAIRSAVDSGEITLVVAEEDEEDY
ncbi:flagellar motor switch protein FliG [Flavimaricola marinus]|uniref:Flagellar motor switch protein FliG n=1 Tax=Flavimaricola marinus TaxID=1819565 RepID=A0A238LHF9_9RHOB|nr:FliG C-terminal domain-containing protein [Flavimaricola marinus]SMY09068.1 Flagellar motor switch protein FliG [Flavimaricola marinus]